MKPFELHPIAIEELIESARFYEERSPGFGDKFLDKFFALMERLGNYPESGSRISKRIRVAMVSDFPYSAVYRVERDRIYVVAVAHQSRRPGYWKGRI
jgi:toxin ParE1/3/4